MRYKITRESESRILAATRDVLRLNGWYVVRHQAGLGTHRGLSDLQAIRGGRTIYIECKTGRGRLSVYQQDFANEIKSRGAEYIVIRSTDQAVDMFNGK